MKFLYVAFGFISSLAFSSVFALTSFETDEIVDYQKAALSLTGKYEPVYDDKLSVFTYEKLCKGYYTVEKVGDYTVYTGFGELADNYTYEIYTPKVDPVASTTVDTEPIISDLNI